MSSEPAGITSECQPMRGNDHDSSTASDIGSDMESPMTSPPRATPGGPSSRSVGFKVPSLAFGRPGLSMDAHNSNPSTRTSLAGRYESGAVSNDASSGLNYAVELLSPAFGIVQETSPLDPKYLRQECASKLGVIEDRLRLYALVPVDVNNSNKLGPHEPFRIAMEVQNSGKRAIFVNEQAVLGVSPVNKIQTTNLHLLQTFLCVRSKMCWRKIIGWVRMPLRKRALSFHYKKKLHGFDNILSHLNCFATVVSRRYRSWRKNSKRFISIWCSTPIPCYRLVAQGQGNHWEWMLGAIISLSRKHIPTWLGTACYEKWQIKTSLLYNTTISFGRLKPKERLHVTIMFLGDLYSVPIDESFFETLPWAPLSQILKLWAPPSWRLVASSLRWFESAIGQKNVDFLSLGEHVTTRASNAARKFMKMSSRTLISIWCSKGWGILYPANVTVGSFSNCLKYGRRLSNSSFYNIFIYPWQKYCLCWVRQKFTSKNCISNWEARGWWLTFAPRCLSYGPRVVW